MPAVSPPPAEVGQPLPSFELRDFDGRRVTQDDLLGSVSLVAFICNHCPFVQSIVDDMVADFHELMDHGVQVLSVMSNDIDAYPDDAPERMQQLANDHGFRFPYLFDSTQEVARAFQAVCTPDFYGYNSQGKLQYHGRYDTRERDALPGVQHAMSDLKQAMLQIAQTGLGPTHQTPSIGCSIKWKPRDTD